MIDADKFLAYQLALTTNANLTVSEVEKLLKSIEGLSPIEQAEYLMANYPKLVRAYGSAASDVARQFYQETRNEYFGDGDGEESFVARPAMAIPEAWAVEDIRKSARGGYARLPGIAVRRVMERADDTFRLNIRRDPKKARWAVVPHPGACGWCVLIAGNGWRYSRESADAQRHDNCKCSIVADFDADSPELEGYDPKWMQQAYAKCEETVHDSVDQLWNELPAEKKAKYLKKGGRGKDGFKRDLVVAEMNRRDREWLRTGVPCHRTKEPGAKPLKKERDVGTALLLHGFNVEFIKEVNLTGIKTADARLNGEVWEFKIPEGWNGEHTIRKQFYKAKDKGTHRLLISATKNGADIAEMGKWVLETFRKGDYAYITEVLLISADGETLQRLYR